MKYFDKCLNKLYTESSKNIIAALTFGGSQ